MFAPEWIDSETLRYWSGDGVYKRRVTHERLGKPRGTDATMQDLVGGNEDDVSADGVKFSKCLNVAELNREVCVDTRAKTNFRRPCVCPVCTGGETPPIASFPFKLKILKAGIIDVRIGGWVGFNFQGLNACFWAGEPDTKNCAYECVGSGGVPAPADVKDAFRPLLEPNGVDPDSQTGLIAVTLLVAAIVALPGPTPV